MRVHILIIAAAAIAATGCSRDAAQGGLSEAPTDRVFGGPSEDALFAPYQGDWTLEDRTFDPPLKGATISGGPDISVNGHIIRFTSGILVSELRLCQTRETEDGIECEAWHHEDIHDPGDMQRADCKLRVKDDKLELHWRIVGSGDFTDDPIIASSEYVPPDRQDNPDTLTWWIEVYSQKPAK
jgi:hypothetical protein